MRLTAFQIHTICESGEKNFGENTQVWLFGSRVDDEARGGDIDLYIEPKTQKPKRYGVFTPFQAFQISVKKSSFENEIYAKSHFLHII